MYRSLTILLAGALIAGAAAASPLDRPRTENLIPARPTAIQGVERGDLMETLASAGQFKTFISLIDAAGIDERLKKGGPYTVFAPTDEAFSALPKDRLAQLESPDHRADLQNLVYYHIVPGEVTSAKMSGTQTIETLQGSDLTIAATMDTVEVNGAALSKGDMLAANGVVHGISAVLMPSSASDVVAEAK